MSFTISGVDVWQPLESPVAPGAVKGTTTGPLTPAPPLWMCAATVGSVTFAAMTTWFLLLLSQSLLIATGRRAIHRKAGVAGLAVAAIIVVLNPLVTVRSVAHGLADGSPIQLVSLILIADLLLMVVFAVLTGLAIRWRRYPETHSRLLLLASIAVASPALGRLALNTLGTPIPGVLGQIAIALLVVGHDLKMSRRVHPASAWGAGAIIATLLFSIALSNVEAAQSAVRSLAN